MKSTTRIAPRLAATAGLALAVIVAPAAPAEDRAFRPPKVEFVAVAGLPCLQPVVNVSSVELADYRAAESRWLTSKYPGFSAPRAETEILIEPALATGAQPMRTTVQRETVHLDGIVGSDAVVCFDINLTTHPAATHE